MLKHLAYGEDYWFSQRLHGHDRRPPFDTVDWQADPDWPGAPGRTVRHPACDGSSSTRSRSMVTTTVTPTSSANRWTGKPESSRPEGLSGPAAP